MVLEGGTGANKPRLVREEARNDNVNAGDADDGDVTHQCEIASPPRLPLDADTTIREDAEHLGGLLARNQTEGHRKIMLGETGILLPEGKIYAMFDVSGDMGHCSERATLGEILGIGCFGETLLPKSIKSTLEKIPPGRAVGYFQADYEFVSTNTIHDYLNFLGRLHEMPADLILQRVRALSESLQLPHEHTRFIDLSRSDERRVHLAAALIHSPSLLILESPTWKQDASSREKIWSLLTDLTRDDGVTVLLRTDDPKEAGHADIVGFFDLGRVIAEDSPDRLLKEFQCGTLEEVFRKLQDGQRGEVVRHSKSSEAAMEERHTTAWETEPKKAPLCKASHGMEFSSAATAVTSGSIGSTEQLKIFLDSWRRILLLIVYKKNLLKKHPYTKGRLVLWTFMIGISIECLVCMTIGSERLAVVKSDANSTFAEVLLDSLPEKRIHQRPYSQRREALASMKRGETSAVMEIGRNFSTAPHYRLQCTFATENNQTSHNSTLDINLKTIDQGTRFILLQTIFIDIFEDLRRNILEAKNASHAQITLEIRDPVYGSRFSSRLEFLAPRLLIHVPFLVAMLHAASQIHINSAVMKMHLALAGVKHFEIIISTLLSLLLSLVLLAAGILGCISLLHWGSLLPLEGSPTLVIRLILEQGLQGIAVGLTIATLDRIFKATIGRELSPVSLFLGIHYSAFSFLLAALWPRLIMPDIIRSIQHYLLPTRSSESLSHMMFRGSSLENKEVAIGFTALEQLTGFSAFFVAFYLPVSAFVRIFHYFMLRRFESKGNSTMPEEGDESRSDEPRIFTL